MSFGNKVKLVSQMHGSIIDLEINDQPIEDVVHIELTNGGTDNALMTVTILVNELEVDADDMDVRTKQLAIDHARKQNAN